MTQASPGKIERLHRTPAGSTALAFDGTGLCDQWPARPAKDASYPVSVRQVAALLHTSFRRHLAMTPLCFASPSPPSGWTGDFHSPAIEHAGHTTLTRAARDFAASKPEFARSVGLAALQWLLCGYGYELTAQDVVDALNHTLEAARHNGTEADTVRRIQLLVDQHQ